MVSHQEGRTGGQGATVLLGVGGTMFWARIRAKRARRLRTLFSMILVMTTPILPAPELSVFDTPGRVPVSISASALAVEPDLVGTVDQSSGVWSLRDANGDTFTFFYGNPGDVPFAGDWDCDGVDTPGLYRQSHGFVYLRNADSQGFRRWHRTSGLGPRTVLLISHQRSG